MCFCFKIVFACIVLSFDTQDVAEAHGLTSQALRSAQIADSADSALRSGGERGTERGPPRSAPGALHVSLQELYELKTLRVKIYEAGKIE